MADKEREWLIRNETWVTAATVTELIEQARLEQARDCVEELEALSRRLVAAELERDQLKSERDQLKLIPLDRLAAADLARMRSELTNIRWALVYANSRKVAAERVVDAAKVVRRFIASSLTGHTVVVSHYYDPLCEALDGYDDEVGAALDVLVEKAIQRNE